MTTRLTRLLPWLLCLGLICTVVITATAQNVISGEISGVVTDPSGAVVPNATITLTSKEMGINQTTTTGSSGAFRFPLLRPGQYSVLTSAKGFSKTEQLVTVSLGQVTALPVQLKVGSATETLEVTTAAPLIETETANLVTNYNTQQVELAPNPGQDITHYAITAPGSVLSTGAGYGNYTSYGMPGNSNLYTINGNDMNDPYNNLNNSGASNNMLGTNEIQELSVVSNGYTGQYGRLGGAQVDITTKSGTNSFHGNARWDYNNSFLNGNEWFNKQSQVAQGIPNQVPHMVSNQWGGSIGGPIKKDKLFFFYDNEGLRYVLPGAGAIPVFVPSQAFSSYVLSVIPAAQQSFYQNIFSIFAGAPGSSTAVPVSLADDPTGAGGCGLFAGTAGFGAAKPCSSVYRSVLGSLNTERLQSARVDYVASSKDHLSFRYWQDRGTQATSTDPINTLWSANSVQPQDAGNMSWTRIFSSNVVNQFIASGFYYSAIFGPPTLNQALQLFPYELDFADGLMASLGGQVGAGVGNFPQGRNITQYQFVDDFSWTKGNHGLKFGANFRRNDVADYSPGFGVNGTYTISDMREFVAGSLNGSASDYFQQFPPTSHNQYSYYSLGIYGQDEWRATSKLKLTMALRLDRNSNISCATNCFAEFPGGFNGIGHSSTIPYNVSINLFHEAIPSVQRFAWQPRFGFIYQLKPTTVVRGGIGIFNDLYPASIAARFSLNAPLDPAFDETAGTIDNPNVAGSSATIAAADAAAFQAAFASGASGTTLKSNMDNITQHLINPRWTEWNLQIEQAIGAKSAFILNYVGNHGSDLFVQNRGLNAWWNQNSSFCTASATAGFPCPANFDNLPTSPPDPRFGRVRSLTNAGVSNYNGLTATLSRKLSKGFTGTASYTWSHTLDDVSNGGIYPYAFTNIDGTGLGGDSIRYQLDPQNLRRLNYSSADYDFRHNFTFNFVWDLPVLSHNKILGGWQVSGDLFARSGEPYSVIRSNMASGELSNYSSSPILAEFLGGPVPSCSDPSAPCLSASQFLGSAGNPPQFSFGNIKRNSFRGPHYFNSDLSVIKNFKITEAFVFSLGANAFNVFNHPNFANPFGILNSGNFGTIVTTVVPSSSPYGNFQGGVFGRVLQLEAKVKF